MEHKPKFNINDIVYIHDEDSANSSQEAIKICKVNAIHIKKRAWMQQGEDNPFRIHYILSSHSCTILEEEITLYNP